MYFVVVREGMLDSGQWRRTFEDTVLPSIPFLLLTLPESLSIVLSGDLLCAHNAPFKTVLFVDIMHVELYWKGEAW